MNFSLQEEKLLKMALRKAARDDSKVYVVRVNSSNPARSDATAKLFEWDASVRKLRAGYVLFTTAIFN